MKINEELWTIRHNLCVEKVQRFCELDTSDIGGFHG
jgi:hypothetical protein